MKKRKYKKNPPKKNNKKVVASVLWGILGGIVTISAPMIGTQIFNNHAQIQEKFTQLETYVTNVTYDGEYIYTDCKSKNAQSNRRQNIMALRDDLKDLINIHRSLGYLVSLPTYCKLHALTHYSDELQTENANSCQYRKIKNEQEIDKWKEEIITQIKKNENERRGLGSAFIEYFSNLSGDKYTPDLCNDYYKGHKYSTK